MFLADGLTDEVSNANAWLSITTFWDGADKLIPVLLRDTKHFVRDFPAVAPQMSMAHLQFLLRGRQ